MRRFAALTLALVMTLAVAGCVPSDEERRSELADDLTSLDAVEVARVDRAEVSVGVERGTSVDAAEDVIREVRSLVLAFGEPDEFTSVAVWFSGHDDRRWFGSWRNGALDSDGFTQQAAFVASLLDAEELSAADAPYMSIAIRFIGAGTTTKTDIAIEEFRSDDERQRALRAALQEHWLSTGGDPDEKIING